MSTRQGIVETLSRFDAGIAPTMGELVAIVLESNPNLTATGVRHVMSALVASGVVSSRWDGDAYVYWIK